ncbi:MAG: hypothetical protein K6A41_09870 [Bacteroidales bacterium]|nr:hypothetical protein [Bacteroidales bacterium]
MQKRTIKLLIFFLLCFPLWISAQDEIKSYPVINEDGSVAFSYQDSTAKKVKILCDCRLHRDTKTIRRENYHQAKMEKGEDGLWRYMTPPLTPEVYTYQFKIEGHRFPDPKNPEPVRVHKEQRSTFVVSGTSQSDLYISGTLAGKLDTLTFHRHSKKKDRQILVYTPPQYTDSQKSFPVLYLLHGISGDAFNWMERGRAVQTLDHLIVMRKAVPMILVMPDANPECLISEKEDISLFKNLLLYPSWSKREFEQCFPELENYLSKQYRFSTHPGSRAVAGLSAGAKQAANIANMLDNTFSSVGLFSPVVSNKQIPNSTSWDIWISSGTGDLFRPQINQYCKKLKNKHIPYNFYNTKGGHTWRNWRVYFSEYVQTLFWNHY